MTNKYNWNYNFLQMFKKNIIVRTNINEMWKKIDSPWHWILVESQEPIFNNAVKGRATIEPKESMMIHASI